MIKTGRRDDELHYFGDLIDAALGRFEAQRLGHYGVRAGKTKCRSVGGILYQGLGDPWHQALDLLS